MSKEVRILGILISDRIKEAGRTQSVLSDYARLIKSRLGFHEVSEDVCSRTGIILLQLTGQTAEFDELEEKLRQIGGIELQKMSFNI
jgi:hypothetical protein